MVLIQYDGSFEGFLSAIYDAYEHRFDPVRIVPVYRFQPSLTDETFISLTCPVKAQRVWKGLKKKISLQAISQFYRCFLSEIMNIEDSLFEYAKYSFSSKISVEYDFNNPAVRKVCDTAKKVYREKHRMEAFVRFELTKDQVYYAVIDPDYNVLPLIITHFKTRYADQQWIIYDCRRKYGIYYDLSEIAEIIFTFSDDVLNGKPSARLYDDSETLFQALWKQYFKSVNIKARKNTKLHVQHMPKRYWKYLTEKQTGQK